MTSFQRLMGFGLVGMFGTGAHYLILVLLVEVVRLDPTLATTIGFTVGASVNYGLNHRYVFSSTKTHRETVPKFLIVATATGLLNTLLVYAIFHWGSFNYLLAQVVSTAVVFFANVALNSVWTFREPGPM